MEKTKEQERIALLRSKKKTLLAKKEKLDTQLQNVNKELDGLKANIMTT